MTPPPRLTSLAQGAGCASKIRSADLGELLSRFSFLADPSLLVGLSPADDAAVWRLSETLAIVFTTDFFAPLVDDPRTYGRIAATNAISDVYAMGGEPKMALNIVAFPTRAYGVELLAEVLAGGADAAAAAGVSIAGGHSVEDPEPKYGLAVLGTVDPRALWHKGGAREGDLLVLTKALGTGLIVTAAKRDGIAQDHPALAAAVASMTTLNARPAALARALGLDVHAATDVTGYGLVGHLREMLAASPARRATLFADALPRLPDVEALVAAGFVSGGSRANRQSAGAFLTLGPGAPEWLATLACDAQTSGGLLFALPEAQAQTFARALVDEGFAAAVVGRVDAGDAVAVTLQSSSA
ncbi:MAG: selenide, water dikinase SelD [Myxococcales bacterium]|nr:selenide, water dikinase SelD [Myxococcales bacterium]